MYAVWAMIDGQKNTKWDPRKEENERYNERFG